AVERLPGARLFAALPAGGEARRDLEAAAAQPVTADRHRHLIALARRIRRRDALERDRPAGRVHRVVEVTEMARLFAEATGYVRIRSFFEAHRRQWDCQCRDKRRYYNPQHRRTV